MPNTVISATRTVRECLFAAECAKRAAAIDLGLIAVAIVSALGLSGVF